jgi:hypothetical protein
MSVRQLQHPRPTVDPSVPPFSKKFRRQRPRPLVGRVSVSIKSRKTDRTDRAGDSCSRVRILCFSKTLRTWLPSQLLIPRIAAAGTFSNPLPCQAWHGYIINDAHRVEVEVDADGHPSAPPSGAAAAAPPAGAGTSDTFVKTVKPTFIATY